MIQLRHEYGRKKMRAKRAPHVVCFDYGYDRRETRDLVREGADARGQASAHAANANSNRWLWRKIKPALTLPPTRYPYRIYYAVLGDDVVILHIRHTARSTPEDLRS